MFKNFFRKDEVSNLSQAQESDVVLRLMFEIAMSDGNLDKAELELLKKRAAQINASDKKPSEIIKAFNAQEKFMKKFASSTLRFFNFSNKLLNRQNLASPVSEFLGILVISVLLWYGGSMVLVDQTLNGAIFLSYLGLAYNILTPAKGISKALYNIKKGDAAAQRVLDILEANDDMEDSTKSVSYTHLTLPTKA